MKLPDKDIKILLIENNPDDVVIIQKLLEQAGGGIYLEIAECLSEGLTRLAQGGGDLVLLNLDLPDSHGLESLTKIISSAPKAHIVVLTDKNELSLGAEAIKVGAQDVLVKGRSSSDSLLRLLHLVAERHLPSRSCAGAVRRQPSSGSEAWLPTLIEQNVDGMMVLDEEGIVRFANSAAQDILGKELQVLIGFSFGHPVLAGETAEIDIPRRGELLVAELRSVAIDWESRPATLVSLRDVTARKCREDQLRVLAGTDPLTGAANRRAFMQRASEEYARARRHGHDMAFLMMDVDKFKLINDTYGHQTGDEVLKAVVHKVKNVLRQTDVIGRLGGDEFGVIVVETDAEGADLVAHRLQDKFAKTAVNVAQDEIGKSMIEGSVGKRDSMPIYANSRHKSVNFTVSMGLATLRTNDFSLEEIMNRADRALYEAKSQGKGLVV